MKECYHVVIDGLYLSDWKFLSILLKEIDSIEYRDATQAEENIPVYLILLVLGCFVHKIDKKTLDI